MSEEKEKPKKAPKTLSAPVRPEPVVYIGPTLRKSGLAQGSVYKGEPDFVAEMKRELPVLANLFVSPAKLGKALERLDAPGENALKAAYNAVATTFGGA